MQKADIARNAVSLSIIIPVYNAAQYLGRCLDSIDLTLEMDIEIICVDDGSTDNSVALIKEAMKLDTRLRLYQLPTNSGAPAARNLAIEKSKGDYILFMDADDQLVPAALKRLCGQAHERDLDAIKGCMLVLKGDESTIPHHLNQKRQWRNTNVNDCHEIAHLYQYQSYLFKSSLIKGHHIQFNERLKNFQDPVFMSHLLPLCRKIDVMLEPLYIRTITPNSIITSRWTFDNYTSLTDGVGEAYNALIETESYESAKYLAKSFSHWWHKFELMTKSLTKNECFDIYVKIEAFSAASRYELCDLRWKTIGPYHVLMLIADGNFEKAYARMRSALYQPNRIPGIMSNTAKGLVYLRDRYW